MSTLYDFKVKNAKGEDVALAGYQGKVVLVVNVASECGFTPQYQGLQQLYEQFSERGFVVLGFPCNQFGGQEKGSNAEIQDFCTGRFSVRFPVFAKIDVNGDAAHPLYTHLKHEAPGILGTEGIKWNFTKFLIGKDGHVIKRYAPTDKPESMAQDIEEALKG